MLAIDSIQTMFTEQFASAPGSIGQVRESAAQLVQFAKRSGQATVLVGHVTKEGAFAGPRVLEHMVDTVLYFEGDRGHSFRILRAVKNRFGSTNEIGVFEMKEQGLQAVPIRRRCSSPSGRWTCRARWSSPASRGRGRSWSSCRRWCRRARSARRGGRRSAWTSNRVALLVAILEKKMGLQLTGQDIFVNVAGGVHLDEPAADLGALVAVASSFLDKPIDPHTLIIGEVGLAGEVRAIGQAEARVREGSKLGFKRCVLPESSRKQLPALRGVELRGVASLNEAWEMLF